jgi:alpha-galactosidase
VDKKDGSRPLYQRMGEALHSCGRPIFYALCQYGQDDVWKWGPEVGANSWRTTIDSRDNWQVMTDIGFRQEALAPYAGPGHWNDPDYLMVGLGRMSTEEYRTQMSLWCMLAAPLSIAPDLRKLCADSRSILLNKDIIAIDQDRLGRQARRVERSGALETWGRPLVNGGHAVALFNRGETAAPMSVDFASLGLSVRKEALDVWSGREVAISDGVYHTSVPPHGAVVLRI